MRLARVVAEGVELEHLVIALSDVELPLADAHRLDRVAVVVEEPVAGGLIGLSGEEPRAVDAVDDAAAGRRGAAQRRERREDVDRAHDAVADHARWDDAGPTDDERIALAAFPRGALGTAQRPVGRSEIRPAPVVRGEHHERLVVDPEPLELGEQPAGGPVDRRNRRSVRPVRALAEEPLLDVDGEVDVHVREVEEEKAAGVLPDEPDGVLDVPLGDADLIGLFLDHLFVAQERERRPLRRRAAGNGGLTTHVVAVRDAVVAVESVTGGQELGLVAAVPLADDPRGVPLGLQHGGDGGLLRVEPDRLSGEEHPSPLELAEPDPPRVAAGEHRAAGGRADRRGHVELGEPHALGGHPVQVRGAVERVAVAGQVTPAEVVTVDEDHVRGVGHAASYPRDAGV